MTAASPGPTAPAATSPAAVAPVVVTPAPVKLEFPLAGFRINAFETPAKALNSFTMYLPVADQSQRLPGVTIATQAPSREKPNLPEYIKYAKTVHDHYGDTVLQQRQPSSAEWLEESTTSRNKINEHTYLRVFYANGLAYEISATALDSQWTDVGPKLKACVESFELSPAPAPGKMSFPQQGFRLSLLDGATPAGAAQSRLSLLNRMGAGIEPNTKTLQDVQAAGHLPHFRVYQAKFKILAESSPAENVLVTEYDVEMPGDGIHPGNPHAHIYEKAIFAHGQLYWATGLHQDIDGDLSAAQIKAWVDSLEAMPVPAKSL